MSTLEICPVCCEGSLHPYFFSKELKHKNVTCHASAFEASRCNVCGTSVANAEQTKRNKLMALNFERSVDGYLQTSDIFKIRKQLGLSQRKASALICGGGNSFAKYENGLIKQSAAVDNLLRVLREHPSSISVLIAAEEQRRAISSVKEEIYIPVPPPAAEIECNPVVTIVKGFVSVAKTIFFAASSDGNSKPSAPTNAVNFNFVGLQK
ncbi:type II toxin-antitoxin system MqsA family antitoxin [Pseudomonas syringae]|uniref:type II toxin-antitoxin system MqsA family antitoxin n=1 Tax=Pseudomonas syringae TaxID=317 RepID=UPI0009B1C30C|nr:type II toxin-antitoxin system MqsA family antitoxin [Pseudomonas syringae]MBS7418392.1 type II toxin-antitoxin system MqsA family antitoxin [Pseudomonas syringae]MBS7438768.1 type II toxin-antitoxin system MqsA family antitoxin [Pseudomonas syringae]